VCVYRSLLCVTLLSGASMTSVSCICRFLLCVKIGLFCVCIQVSFVRDFAQR